MVRKNRNSGITKLLWIIFLGVTILIGGCYKDDGGTEIEADKNYKIRQDSIKAKYSNNYDKQTR